MTTRPKYWGRERELAILGERLASARSAVLIHGEPQIGKTALVEEVRLRLSEGGAHEYRFGSHKAVATNYDPFTYAIASLLADVYRMEHVSDQLSIIGAKLRSKLTLTKFKEFCYVIWTAVAEIPGLKPIDKVVSWFKTESEGLDLSLKPTALSAFDVEQVLSALSDACPGNQFVLVVDDYSAGYESGLGGATQSWGNGTLLHLLKCRIKNVHVLITWKETGETIDALEQVKHLFLQYGGEMLKLSDLNSADVIAWIREEMPTLKEALGERKLVDLIEGLPKVGAELKAENVLDPEMATRMARQIKFGSYDYLHSYLKRCDKMQRDLLLQIAVLPLAVRTSQLAQLMGFPEEEVFSQLKSAVASNLLRQVAEDVFMFQHDIKRSVVLDHLNQFHSRVHFLERALRYSEWEIDVLGPHAILNILCAFRTAGVLAGLAPKYQRVSAFYLHYVSLITESLRSKPSEAFLIEMVTDEAFMQRPVRLRLAVYSSLFRGVADDAALLPGEIAVKMSDRSARNAPLRVAAVHVVDLARQSPLTDACAIEVINALKLVVPFLGGEGDADAVEILRLLRASMDRSSSSINLLIEVAGTAVNLTGSYPDLEIARNALILAEALAVDHPGNPELQESFGQALVNVIKRETSVERVTTALEKLENLEGATRPIDSTTGIEEVIICGLYDAAITLDDLGQREEIARIVGRTVSFARKHRESRSVTSYCASALYNATAFFGRADDPRSADHAFHELKELVKAYPEDLQIAINSARAAGNICEIGSHLEDRYRVRDALATIRELESTWGVSLTLNADVLDALAMVIVGQLYVGETKLARQAFTEWDIEQQLVSIESAVYMVHALANASGRLPLNEVATHSTHLCNRESAIFIRDVVLTIRKRHSTSLTVGQGAAFALANLMGWPALFDTSDVRGELRGSLQYIGDCFREDDQIASEVGRGMALGWLAVLTGFAEDTFPYEAECRKLGGRVFATFEEFRSKVSVPK